MTIKLIYLYTISILLISCASNYSHRGVASNKRSESPNKMLMLADNPTINILLGTKKQIHAIIKDMNSKGKCLMWLEKDASLERMEPSIKTRQHKTSDQNGLPNDIFGYNFSEGKPFSTRSEVNDLFESFPVLNIYYKLDDPNSGTKVFGVSTSSDESRAKMNKSDNCVKAIFPIVLGESLDDQNRQVNYYLGGVVDEIDINKSKWQKVRERFVPFKTYYYISKEVTINDKDDKYLDIDFVQIIKF